MLKNIEIWFKLELVLNLIPQCVMQSPHSVYEVWWWVFLCLFWPKDVSADDSRLGREKFYREGVTACLQNLWLTIWQPADIFSRI